VHPLRCFVAPALHTQSVHPLRKCASLAFLCGTSLAREEMPTCTKMAHYPPPGCFLPHMCTQNTFASVLHLYIRARTSPCFQGCIFYSDIHTLYTELARTVYMQCIRPYLWWFPCQKYRIYTVHIWFWPTLHVYTPLHICTFAPASLSYTPAYTNSARAHNSTHYLNARASNADPRQCRC
jgi:hypothetical protein